MLVPSDVEVDVEVRCPPWLPSFHCRHCGRSALPRGRSPGCHAAGRAIKSWWRLPVCAVAPWPPPHQVRLVDQLQIIEFGKLNHLKRDILQKLEAVKVRWRVWEGRAVAPA